MAPFPSAHTLDERGKKVFIKISGGRISVWILVGCMYLSSITFFFVDDRSAKGINWSDISRSSKRIGLQADLNQPPRRKKVRPGHYDKNIQGINGI